MNAKQRRATRRTYYAWTPPPPIASEAEPEQLYQHHVAEHEATYERESYARHVEPTSRWKGFLAAALTGLAVGCGLIASAAIAVRWGWLQ